MRAGPFVSTGYLTNLVVAQGLAGKISHAFVDEQVIASLQDALKFLDAPIKTFKHRCPEDLQSKLSRIARSSSIAVLTDGLFAHNGSIAPLAEYRKVLGPKALLWIDDSHAAGILEKMGGARSKQPGYRGRTWFRQLPSAKRLVFTVELSWAGKALSIQFWRAARLLWGTPRCCCP